MYVTVCDVCVNVCRGRGGVTACIGECVYVRMHYVCVCVCVAVQRTPQKS